MVPSIAIARLAILIAGVALLGVVWMGFSALFFDPIAATEGRIAALETQLGDLKLREAKANADLAALPSANSGAVPTNLVSTAPNAAVSSETFQEEIRSTVANVHGTSISSQASTQSLAGGTAKISVLLRARFDELGLLGFAHAIESGTPPMIFDSFEVHPVPTGQGASTLEFTGILTGFHVDAR